MLGLWTAAALAGEGEAPDPHDAWVLHAGEFRNNAQTMPKGAFTLRPFLRSSYGITDRIDVKGPLLGQVFGPNVSVELGLLRTDALAIAFEPYLDAGWRFRNWEIGGVARVSVAAGPGWVNLNVGGAVGHLYAVETVVDADGVETEVTIDAPLRLVPVNVGYDWIVQERTWVRFVATTDAAALAVGRPPLTAGGSWTHAFGRLRLALGAVLVVEQPFRTPVPLPGQDRLLKSAIYPAPTLELWGRW